MGNFLTSFPVTGRSGCALDLPNCLENVVLRIVKIRREVLFLDRESGDDQVPTNRSGSYTFTDQ